MRKNWNRQEQKNNMNRLAKWWQSFDEKHPIAARWIREGGLFVIVSNLITVFKYVLLQFLPKAFAGLLAGLIRSYDRDDKLDKVKAELA